MTRNLRLCETAPPIIAMLELRDMLAAGGTIDALPNNWLLAPLSSDANLTRVAEVLAVKVPSAVGGTDSMVIYGA